jgi:hypothetical protein
MSRMSKIVLLFTVLTGTVLISFADRGLSKRSKNKVVLNINTKSTFKNNLSFNLRTGLKYKGSLIQSSDKVSNSINNLVTYQKGNTVYIVPVKSKLIMPEVKQNYAGVKLVIRSKN